MFSPDGTMIAYVDGSTGQPWVMAADGALARSVTPLSADHLSWAPDSSQLAFSSYVAGENAASVWRVPANGGSPQRVMTGPPATTNFDQSLVASVAWSPDDSRIGAFFEFNTEQSAADWIEVADVDGTNAHQVATVAPPVPGPNFAWSPDGRRIAYSGGGVVTVNPDGTGRTPVGGTSVRAVEAWAPDGSSIVYQSTRIGSGGQGVADLRAIAPDGSGDHLIAGADKTSEWDQQVTWSPDAARLVFTGAIQPTQAGDLYAVSAAGSGLAQLTTSGSAHNPTYGPWVTTRYLGILRTDTAVDLARHIWTSAPAVVVARDDTYPDALAAAPVAAAVHGPLLLTDPTNLPTPVCDEIRTLGATTADIMGDTTAVSSAVEGQLASCGITRTARLQGSTRFDTAAAAATFVGGPSVYITEGANPDPTKGWPDAVSVSDLAARQRRPILLVTAESVPTATHNALRSLGVTNAIIVGGTAAVSDQVASQIASMGITVSRIAGADRYATSAAVASQITQGQNRPWLAIGNNWPDALSAGPAAAEAGGDLLLVDGTTLANSPASQSWLTQQGTNIVDVHLVGGPDVLSPEDAVQATRIALGE